MAAPGSSGSGHSRARFNNKNIISDLHTTASGCAIRSEVAVDQSSDDAGRVLTMERRVVVPDLYSIINEVDSATIARVAVAMEETCDLPIRPGDTRWSTGAGGWLRYRSRQPGARILARVKSVVGVDPSPALLAQARDLAVGIGSLSFQEGDGRALPLDRPDGGRGRLPSGPVACGRTRVRVVSPVHWFVPTAQHRETRVVPGVNARLLSDHSRHEHMTGCRAGRWPPAPLGSATSQSRAMMTESGTNGFGVARCGQRSGVGAWRSRSVWASVSSYGKLR